MGKKFQATFSQPVAPPRDYFVPNFGADHDISMTGLNLAESEEQHGHKLVAEEPAKEIPRNYFIPNFGKDKEIIATQKHIVDAEKKLGQVWTGENLKQPKEHPIDYFVPNFGMDNEIVSSLGSELSSSAVLNHTWSVDTSAVQLEADSDNSVMLESDPICSSAGCF